MEQNIKQSPIKITLTVVFSFGVAALFMWFALNELDFREIGSYFINADYFWGGISAVFGLLAYGFRAVRWNLLLEPMGYRISVKNALWAISFGYLINLTIPRFGEISRATALFGTEKVPVDKSFGTIILERMVDLLCMLFFLLLTLALKYDAILAFYKQSGMDIPMDRMMLLVGIVFLLGIVFLGLRNKLKSIPVLGSIVDFLNGIISGVLSIFKLKQPFRFVLYSMGIWGSYYLATYLMCFAIDGTSGFTFADGFYLIVIGTLGMIIPASGGIGAFHLALKLGVGALFISLGKPFGEGEQAGLAYAFVSHTMQLVIILVMGLIAIPMLARARNKNRLK